MIKEKNVIQWLENKITGLSIQLLDGYLTITEFMEEQNNIFKEAKEMENKQLEKLKDFDTWKEWKNL
jgi:hypothetical protein